jgi:hypothetical protein
VIREGTGSLRRGSPRLRGVGGTVTSGTSRGSILVEGGAVENRGGTVARLLRDSLDDESTGDD